MNSDTIEDIKQENLKHNTPSVPVAREPGGKAHMLLLLLLSSLMFFPSAYISDKLDSPIGDEPHYLPISPVSANPSNSGERSFNMLFEFVHQLVILLANSKMTPNSG